MGDKGKYYLGLLLSLWRLGFRYRVNDRRLPGSPDIVLPKYRTVIIVWECELKKQRLQDTVEATASAIRKNGEILRSAQEDRKKARALYQEERRQQKEREQAFTEELHQKFPR